ncbi:LytR cell envelope-related transcriptional attenuator [Prauserella shujinwangii]|uniref:LytR cell envelope-related transcriptional attenuator n=1 Tax=Prauserella shujinwangii TaxID=1453103 RepID=A0A2T0M159_9PSEU|nr:LytR C-terminal domain-containing protein [Prauserella shujinwangii]PRX50297.1 LytR cell envelope-related transcriptional attenuator [Prauserella shujinwangii]
MSIFDGLSRPARAAGLGLLAVAVVAAVLGGVTLLTGDGEDTAAPSPSPSETTQPGSPGPTQPGQPTTTGPGTATERSPAPTSPAEPGGTGTTRPGQPGEGDGGDGDGDGGADDQQVVAQSVEVRVYNNSTTRGLAARASDEFRAAGWKVVETSNYSSGIIPTSTAYYRPGTSEMKAAKLLAAEFGLRVEPRFEGIADSSPGVIVIVTNDYTGAPKSK